MADYKALWIVDDPDDQLLIEEAFLGQTAPTLVKLLSDGDELVPRLEKASILPKLILPRRRTAGLKYAALECV